MGTRCGDLDPAVVLYLLQTGLGAHEVDQVLNKRSGLLGLAGKADVRAVLADAAAGSARAQLALDVRPLARRPDPYVYALKNLIYRQGQHHARRSGRAAAGSACGMHFLVCAHSTCVPHLECLLPAGV